MQTCYTFKNIMKVQYIFFAALNIVFINCLVSNEDNFSRNHMIFNYKSCNFEEATDDEEKFTINCTGGEYFEMIVTDPISDMVEGAEITIHGRHDGVTRFKPSEEDRFVEGKIKNYPGSHVRGKFLTDGLFDGTIAFSANNVYTVEPSSNYFEDADFDTVLFKYGDVNRTLVCEEARRVGNTPKDELKVLCEAGNSNGDKIPISGNGNSRGRGKPRQPSSERWANKVCSLIIVADHLFFEHVGKKDIRTTILEMNSAIKRMEAIFMSTKFLNEELPEGIGFYVKSYQVFENDKSANYFVRSVTNVKASDYLKQFQRHYTQLENYCMGIVFTYINFSDGKSGVAIQADRNDMDVVRGICAKSENETVGGKQHPVAMNAMVISYNYRGKSISRKQIIPVMAHEMGHSFGARHDDTPDCMPAAKMGGLYVMGAKLATANQPNHWKFSPCSTADIAKVLLVKAPICFDDSSVKRDPKILCGNGVVDENEECDCGNSKDCNKIDPCCRPSDYTGTEDKPCTVARGSDKKYKCSPRTAGCCSEWCQPISKKMKKVCRRRTVCADEETCDGINPHCPLRSQNAGENCEGGRGRCLNGSCHSTDLENGCTQYKFGVGVCSCANVEWQCFACCQTRVGCKPLIIMLNATLKDMKGWYMPKSWPCENGVGDCDGFGVCHITDDTSGTTVVYAVIFLGLLGACGVVYMWLVGWTKVDKWLQVCKRRERDEYEDD